MKSVPPHIVALGPEGTAWYGGRVDRLKMSLRVHATGEDRDEVSRLLACPYNPARKAWRVEAPQSLDGDLDSMVVGLLNRLSMDMSAWQSVNGRWKVDLFCGLFLERPNRGLGLSAESMTLLGERGIRLELDIYSPDGPQT